jgi:hypothetical protein
MPSNRPLPSLLVTRLCSVSEPIGVSRPGIRSMDPMTGCHCLRLNQYHDDIGPRTGGLLPTIRSLRLSSSVMLLSPSIPKVGLLMKPNPIHDTQFIPRKQESRTWISALARRPLHFRTKGWARILFSLEHRQQMECLRIALIHSPPASFSPNSHRYHPPSQILVSGLLLRWIKKTTDPTFHNHLSVGVEEVFHPSGRS